MMPRSGISGRSRPIGGVTSAVLTPRPAVCTQTDMRNLLHMKGRIPNDGALDPENEGMFLIYRPGISDALKVIACAGGGWDHVSVSRHDRVPEWGDMEFVKRRFFEDHETAMQLHVPPAVHINCHPFALHLWRPNDGRHSIPRPPLGMV